MLTMLIAAGINGHGQTLLSKKLQLTTDPVAHFIPIDQKGIALKADTIKPVVNLLGIVDINLSCDSVYMDAPIELTDDVSTDAEMRPILVVLSELPKNAAGLQFCDCKGPYHTFYIARDLAGNISDTAVRTIHCIPATGVHDILNREKMVNVFPNPGKGIFHIGMEDLYNNEVVLTVIDMTGRTILSRTFKPNNSLDEELDLHAAPAGCYLLRIQTGQKNIIKKLQLIE